MIIVLVLTSIISLLSCDTFVYIQNHTPTSFAFASKQYGETLPPDQWSFHSDPIPIANRSKLGWFTRNPAYILPGKEYFFIQKTDFPNIGSVTLEQRLVGSDKKNELYYRIGNYLATEIDEK